MAKVLVGIGGKLAEAETHEWSSLKVGDAVAVDKHGYVRRPTSGEMAIGIVCAKATPEGCLAVTNERKRRAKR